jgi:hypothetical protein
MTTDRVAHPGKRALVTASCVGVCMALVATFLLRDAVFSPLLFAGAAVPWWYYLATAGIGTGLSFVVVLALAPSLQSHSDPK